ncbi:MAG: protein-L-isoaspartate(D-aspartate) O-methyltransferase [Armatimonadota bacterium]
MSDDFQREKSRLFDIILKRDNIADEKVVSAMRNVPRHLFVPENMRHASYDNRALPIGYNQTISQPTMVAIMTQELDLSKDDKVLEIGTGSGYQAAILSLLAKEVYTIERNPYLAQRAKKLLADLGYNNIYVLYGDGTEGYKEAAPYDKIIGTAGSPDVPEPLIEQLKDGGVLVIPIGNSEIQRLLKITKRGNRITRSHVTDCYFVPMIGKYGWKE